MCGEIFKMPVYIKNRVEKGWKKDVNDRVGPVNVWIFCDEKTNKELFRYAANLVDEAFFVNGFKQLKVLDDLNKSYAKAKDILANFEIEIENFSNAINSSQTTIDWNNTCRLKSEVKNEST